MGRFKHALAALFLAASAAAAAAQVYDPVTMDPPRVDAAHPPALAELSFDSHGARLNGSIFLADGAGPHPTVILLHGYPGNERNFDLAQALRRGGFNVLFFHYRGAWGSGGDFSFTHVIEDVASAADMLRARAGELRVDPARILLIGHSMGGFAALQGAANDARVRCAAGIAPGDFGAIADYLAQDAASMDSFSAYADSLDMLAGWSGDAVRAELAAHRDAFSLVALAPRLSGKSILLIAADADEVLPPAVFHAPIVAAYRAQAGLTLTDVTLSGDHSFSWSRFALARTVLDWARACAGP